MNKTQYKPSPTILLKENVYIDNSIFMEFVDDIATQITELVFKDETTIEVKDGLSDSTAIIFTDDAQDYYNDKYNEIETMLNNTLNIYSKNELF
jgi:hypothetical protein